MDSDIIEFIPADEIIPVMTHPLSKAWDQPKLNSIEISKEYARMDKDACDMLFNYSAGIPSGVYEGKMWKSFDETHWFLHWYDVSKKNPNQCAIHTRKISIKFL